MRAIVMLFNLLLHPTGCCCERERVLVTSTIPALREAAAAHLVASRRAIAAARTNERVGRLLTETLEGGA